MIRQDDPMLTAYVLGELSPAERAEVDLAAASDPAVRAAIDEAVAAAGVLTTALKQEQSSDAGPVLDSSQRAAILERAASGAPILSLTSRLRRWGLFAATAAAVMVGAFLWVNQPADPTTERRSMYAFRDGGLGRIEIVGRIDMVDGDTVIAGSSVSPVLPDGSSAQPPAFFGSLTAGSGVAPPASAPTSVGFTTSLASGPVSASAPVVLQVPTLRTRLSGSGGGAGGAAVWAAESLKRAPKAQGWLLFAGDGDAGFLDRVTNGIEDRGTESYRSYVENAFLVPKGDVALSTFSIDVDTASYANVRRMLNDGHLPNPDAVRVEELVNYFPYAYAAPTGDDPFAVHLEVAGCPWNTTHRLIRVGIKGKEVARKERPASNLVFLVDVSGSMNAPNKLPLVKASLRMLLDELNERDKVSIVVYAGASGLALATTSCEQKNTILEAIDKLVPAGSTNGAAGIQLAYDTAVQSFIPGGVNRVVLCTDGDFNVGVTSHADLLKLIETSAKSKVFLTALGYGMGNYKDDTLELLADKGNGNYGYIDTTREAHKVLVEQSSGTLMTIAKDVKLQVEFNPATVAGYRLVGYDNRLLAAKDFNDDTKDAGEIGAGHTVTAFYEIVPVGVELPVAAADKPVSVDPLKYQQPVPPLNVSGFPPTPRVIVFPNPLPVPVLVPMTPAAPVIFSPTYVPTATSTDLLTVKLRWKAPEGDVSTKNEFALADGGATYDKASADFQFASAVTAFALLLKQSPHRGTANVDAVLEIAGSSLGNDPGAWRAEFVDLVKKAKSLSPTK